MTHVLFNRYVVFVHDVQELSLFSQVLHFGEQGTQVLEVELAKEPDSQLETQFILVKFPTFGVVHVSKQLLVSEAKK